MGFTHHYIEKNKIWKYLDRLISIIFDEADIMNSKTQWFYHVLNFNKEYIIHPYHVNKDIISEEERYISFMTPTLLSNGLDE